VWTGLVIILHNFMESKRRVSFERIRIIVHRTMMMMMMRRWILVDDAELQVKDV